MCFRTVRRACVRAIFEKSSVGPKPSGGAPRVDHPLITEASHVPEVSRL